MPAKTTTKAAATTKRTKTVEMSPAQIDRIVRRALAAEAPVATKVVKTTKTAAKTAPVKAATKTAPVKAAAKTATTKTPVKAAAKTATAKTATAKTAPVKTAPVKTAPVKVAAKTKPVSTERRHAMMLTLSELADAVENLANKPQSVKPAERSELLLEVVRRMRERRGGRVK